MPRCDCGGVEVSVQVLECMETSFNVEGGKLILIPIKFVVGVVSSLVT